VFNFVFYALFITCSIGVAIGLDQLYKVLFFPLEFGAHLRLHAFDLVYIPLGIVSAFAIFFAVLSAPISDWKVVFKSIGVALAAIGFGAVINLNNGYMVAGGHFVYFGLSALKPPIAIDLNNVCTINYFVGSGKIPRRSLSFKMKNGAVFSSGFISFDSGEVLSRHLKVPVNEWRGVNCS